MGTHQKCFLGALGGVGIHPSYGKAVFLPTMQPCLPLHPEKPKNSHWYRWPCHTHPPNVTLENSMPRVPRTLLNLAKSVPAHAVHSCIALPGPLVKTASRSMCNVRFDTLIVNVTRKRVTLRNCSAIARLAVSYPDRNKLQWLKTPCQVALSPRVFLRRIVCSLVCR